VHPGLDALIRLLPAAQVRGVLAAEARSDERLAPQKAGEVAVAVCGQAVLMAGVAARGPPPEAAQVAAVQVV
jgi:hypothetical protein